MSGLLLARRGAVAQPVLPVVVVSDDFSDADSTNLNGKLADTGQAWAVSPGTWSTSSGRAVSTGTDGSVVIDAGVADCTVKAKISSMSSHGYSGLVARWANTTNYLRLRQGGPTTDNNIYLDKVVAGASTILGTYASVYAADMELVLVLSGSSISVYRNGVLKGTVSDSAGSTNTKHGLRAEGAGYGGEAGRTFDDFAVTVPGA